MREHTSSEHAEHTSTLSFNGELQNLSSLRKKVAFSFRFSSAERWLSRPWKKSFCFANESDTFSSSTFFAFRESVCRSYHWNTFPNQCIILSDFSVFHVIWLSFFFFFFLLVLFCNARPVSRYERVLWLEGRSRYTYSQGSTTGHTPFVFVVFIHINSAVYTHPIKTTKPNVFWVYRTTRS